MRAIGYPRVSTHGQERHGYSLEEQVSSIEKFCLDKGIELTSHFIEKESAATIRNRPSFKAAMKHVFDSPDIDAIIVTNLDRFSRSVLDAELIRLAFERRGKKLISIQEQHLTPLQKYDDCDEDYLLAARQHRMVEAEQERKRMRKRMVSGKRQKSLNGGWIGFRPPFEYDVIQGELVYNMERGRVIRHIFRIRKYLGLSFRQIAAYMNGRNGLINSDGTRGRVFLPPAIARKPMRKRRNPITKLKVWGLGSVRNIIACDNGPRTWGTGSERQGKVRAV